MSSKKRLLKGCLWAAAGVVTVALVVFALPFAAWMAVGPDSPDPVDRYDLTATEFRDDGEQFLRGTTEGVSPDLVFHDSGYQVRRDYPSRNGRESPSSTVNRTLTARTVILVGHQPELERRIGDAWTRMGYPVESTEAAPESSTNGTRRTLHTHGPHGLVATVSFEESLMKVPGPRTVRLSITISQDHVQYAPTDYGDLAAGHVPGSRPDDPAGATADDPHWSR